MFDRRLLAGFVLIAIAMPALSQSDDKAAVGRMKKDIFFLASDECEGRGPGTKGIDLAADYIAKTFAENGLKPAGVKTTYFQPFPISGVPILEKPNAFAVKSPKGEKTDFTIDSQYQVMGLSGKGNVTAPLVFAGYGVQTKEHKYDDFAGLDVAKKVVIVLRHSPRFFATDPLGGKDGRDALAALERKFANAESHKAAAVILVNDLGEAKTGDKLMTFDKLKLATSSRIPILQVTREAIEPVIKAALGKSLDDIEKAIDKDLKPQSAELTGWTASVETTVRRQQLEVKNILGIVPGTGPLGNQYVVVGSHYDHLGYGGPGSLAKGSNDIHHGADDNGSGTTAMMELARRFAGRKDRTGRSLLFMAFSAEERGLLGSKFYCNQEPLIPLGDTAAMVNLDMVGRLRPDPMTKKEKLIVQGVGSSKGFGNLIEKLNKQDFTFAKVEAGTGPSDHDSFYRKKVPVLFVWTGVHPDYHKPTDTADKIDLDGMAKIVDFTESVIEKLVTDPERPNYIEVKGGTPSRGPSGPKLGIQPAYDDKEGVGIDAVVDGGAASKAGMKAGDRIIELAGRNVANIETYMVIMSTLRPGQAVDATVLREGKKLTVKVAPQ